MTRCCSGQFTLVLSVSLWYRRACLALLFAVLSVAAFTPEPGSAAVYPGSIPGLFGVTEHGSSTYIIPIEAPAATGGIKPQLAFAYNHMAGNGLAGVGWELAGVSSIVRCQKTFAQDGLMVGYRYMSTDRYCLDGQRLVEVAGSYGAHGTEYRTELESFQRVFQNGVVSSSGAASFYVQHGDGRTSYYGYTADSRVEAVGVGAGAVREWYLSHTEDAFGNRITYHYEENTTTGEVVPTEIRWTSNSGQGLLPRYKIQIV